MFEGWAFLESDFDRFYEVRTKEQMVNLSWRIFVNRARTLLTNEQSSWRNWILALPENQEPEPSPAQPNIIHDPDAAMALWRKASPLRKKDQA